MANTKLTKVERKANIALKIGTDYAPIQTVFSAEIENALSDNGKAYLLAFEQCNGYNDLNDWRKAYYISQLWQDYARKQPKKAKINEFAKYWTGSKTTLYDYFSCGAKVVNNPETGDIIVPKDKDGKPFKVSIYCFIAKRKDLEKEIENGIFTASMTQAEIKAKIKDLKSIVETDESESESESESKSESVQTADNVTTTANGFYLEVNGKEIELTAEQQIKVLEYIHTLKKKEYTVDPVESYGLDDFEA